MVNPNRFYTYAYLREDRTPYYIGKGSYNRIFDKHNNFYPPKDESRIIFLKKNLTEEEAFRHEKYMIFVFGRKDLRTGILHNKSEGGIGGLGKSDSTKQKIRKKIKKLWDDGIYDNEDRNKKISASMKGRKRGSMPQEMKDKISKSKKGKKLTKEQIEKRKQTMYRGEKHHNFGKQRSPETIEKIKKSFEGRVWWNNGQSHKYNVECPGEGWILGRINDSKKK